VIVGSNRGLPTDPAWLANLRAQPGVTVEVGAETFRARAVIAAGAERRRLFDAHAAVLPNFADYERMTEREIPVVTRCASTGADLARQSIGSRSTPRPRRAPAPNR